jgi:hypothetical protein
MRSDFVENSNDSYWMSNPHQPLTGFPRIIGQAGTGQMGSQGTDLGRRTRSALHMIMTRISGNDGLSPPGFTFQDMKNLFCSDIQYGASLIKPELVDMCRAFPGGKAPHQHRQHRGRRLLRRAGGLERPGEPGVTRGGAVPRVLGASAGSEVRPLDAPVRRHAPAHDAVRPEHHEQDRAKVLR